MAEESLSSYSLSSSMSTSGSSPIKATHASYAPHIRSEVEKLLSTNIEILRAADFWKPLGYRARDFTRVDTHVKKAGIQTMEPMRDGVFSSCLNILSAHVRAKFRLDESSEIRFFDTPNTAPKDHPTGTICRPDIVATRQRGAIHWTGIEATVEVHSSGRSVEGAGIQSASYSIFLLQARPDLLAVQGFCVTKTGIMLSIASSSGVKMTEALDMSNHAHRVLLYAFVTRLYEPDEDMIDPSINRRWDENVPCPRFVFDITLNPVDHNPVICSGYRTVYARESLGQRAHIFVNEATPTHYNGVPIPVIKDAYCNENNRFTEAGIINHIHRDGDVPGIVHIVYAEVVCYQGPSHRVIVQDGRQKTRLCLAEFGIGIMKCKTVKDVLIMMYDQLESTRVIYRNCDVLHRDISSGNMMFRNLDVPPHSGNLTTEDFFDEGKNTNPDDTTDSDPPSVFCGARYLLGETDNRSFTQNLLVDWERAEVLSQKQGEERLPRTGTMRFMARAIRAGRLRGGSLISPIFAKLPDVCTSVATKYGAALPHRVKRFACQNAHQPGPVCNPTDIASRHALRHDAESVYWVLVWWAICAAPEGRAASSVDASLWSCLTSSSIRDNRPTTIEDDDLDPSYNALGSLLSSLASLLGNDLHWATKAPFNHPEFLHEAFQRHILNFLVENKNEDFLLLPTSGKPRVPEKFIFYAEPPQRVEHLRNSSTAGISNSLKRPASASGQDEFKRKLKKVTGPVSSSSTGMKTAYQQKRRH